MEREILFSTPFITVEYQPEKQLIYHTIHKPIGGEAQMLKDALNAGAAGLEKYGVCKWLSDDRKNDPLPEGLVEWGATDWNPRVIGAGWKYWANVVPTEIAAAGALMPVINNLHKEGLRMRVFTTVEDAYKWLDEQPNS